MQGGFSIREYASRMRSINVVNCWPFDETFSEETVKSLLPPITVKKFTWWLDELEYIHTESAKNFDSSEKGKKKKKKKKKKQLEKGESSLRNEDRDVEESDIYAGEGMEVVKVKFLKGKTKAPKKRSIVEIFAVAPPVERIISEEEEEAEDSLQEDASFSSNSSHVQINWGRKGEKHGKKRMMKKMKKNTDVILRKALRVVKKIKKKKARKQGEEMGQSAPNKENCFELKLQAHDNATGNPSSSYSKESENDIHDCVSIVKWKPRLQQLDAYKKTVPCKAFNLTEENQHPELPMRGILKNHGKAISLKQSTKCILEEAVQVNHCNAQKADKHVTFSEKDENLKLNRKPSHSVEYFKFQNVCGSDMGSVDHAGGVGKDSTILETRGIEDASIRIRKEVGAQPASNEQLTSFVVDSTTFMKQKNEEEHPRIPEASERSSPHDMSQNWSDSGLSNASHNSIDACPPRFFRMPLDGCYNSPNMKMIRNSSNSTCRRLNNDLGTTGMVFPSLRFQDCLGTFNGASVSHLSNMEKRTYKLPQASSESSAMHTAHSFQFQTYPHRSSKELLHTFCSLSDASQTGYICGRSINGINEDFVGLPLNSQGELITLSSSARREVDEIINSSVSAAHSISISLPGNAVPKCLGNHAECRSLDCGTSSMDKLNLFPTESYVKENPIAVLPSRLGITRSQNEGKTNGDLDSVEMNCHWFHDSENTMCKGDNQVRESPGNEKIQSTMRLMGKEFKVSERSVKGFEDGRVWKDKQIIGELQFGNNSVGNVVHDQNEPCLGKLREPFFCPSEITINHRSESKYALPHIERQTSSMYQSVYVARKNEPVQKLYPSLSPGTFSEVCNSESLFSEPFTSGYESRLFTLQLPSPRAAHQELYPNMSPGAIQNKQNLPHTPISAIKFPFMHPDLDGHAKTSTWSQRSSVNQHPLCFDAPKKATQLRNSQSCILGRNHPYLKPGSSNGTDSSMSFQPGDIFMFSPLSSGSPLQTSVSPASLASMPYYPEVLPVSAVQKRHGNQKRVKERIKSRIGIRGLDNGKKSKGQLSALSAVPFKSSKMPTLGFHENIQCALRKPTARVSFEDSVKNIEDANESCSAMDKSKFVMCGEYETSKDGQIISPWVDSYTDTARTGPVKLTAGGKHILKACQQREQSSFRSIDQDISHSATAIGFRFSESENSAKIYRFSGKAPMCEW